MDEKRKRCQLIECREVGEMETENNMRKTKKKMRKTEKKMRGTEKKMRGTERRKELESICRVKVSISDNSFDYSDAPPSFLVLFFDSSIALIHELRKQLRSLKLQRLLWISSQQSLLSTLSMG